MKTILIATAITAICFILSSNSSPSRNNDLSWIAFCTHHGYPVDTIDRQIDNQFLDTWVGTVEEEKALAR